MTVSEDTAQHIAAQVVGLTYGQNCRPGPLMKPTENQSIPGAIPGECVFVLGTGGEKDIPYIDGGAGTAENLPGVSIFIRSNVNEFDSGKALANSVLSAINMNPPAGYFEARAESSGPIYIRKNDTQHHEFTIDVILKF